MKKISILLTGLAFSVGFGQSQFNQLSEAVNQTITATEGVNDACNVTINADNYWGGAINQSAYASGFSMEPNTAFQAGSLNLLIGVYDDLTYTLTDKDFVVKIYEDDGFFAPGEAISSVTVAPTSATFTQTINLSNGAIVHLYDVTFDLSSMPVANITTLDNWFGIELAEMGDVQVGLNFTLNAPGSMTYYYNVDFWDIFNASAPNNISFVYTLTGDCSAMGVSDVNATELAVYPNPAKDVLNVSLKNADIKSISVTNLSGQTVATSKNATVNVSALPAGVYVVRVVDTKGAVHTSKVVVK